jgi:hypothetical protein
VWGWPHDPEPQQIQQILLVWQPKQADPALLSPLGRTLARMATQDWRFETQTACRRMTLQTMNPHGRQCWISSGDLPGIQHCLVAKPNRVSRLQPCCLSSFDAQIDLNFLL